ncbi:MAG: archaellum operon transcriptional activator EarA family protein [Candidatus Thermoplasmatota archaeon]|nr:archaellum operon transcriptional activator EarA family protein [Candidatus Thermoplasmatota archaeon]
MGYKIIYSLRKSAIRRKVLKYLATIHLQGSYPAEIARATKENKA